MIRNKPLPELLSPAGDMAALLAAISAGADAIYVGGRRFGARAYAKNFDVEELEAAVRICHASGVRLYVTVNTLIHQREMADALEYARTLYRIGVDAIIVCDLGFIKRVREELPELELHASTQMGIHNSYGADFAYALGCERIVLARECSARDIITVTEKCSAEVEVFVHGALCVCHSGQCLFSSMVGGRSGNRGECAQPCRLPFGKDKYPLSLIDLSLAMHIPELISSGVASLKIEGRMKSAEYVYVVTSVFRRLLDEGRIATPAEMVELERAFSRGGFTDGYFTGKISSGMTGVRSEGDKQASREMKVNIPAPEKMKITAAASFLRGKPATLELICIPVSRWGREASEKPIIARSVGEIPTEAINSPLTREGVSVRLAKMGNTPFSLDVDDIDIELDENLNLPPSAINSLRRDGAEELSKALSKPIKELLGNKKTPDGPGKNLLSAALRPDVIAYPDNRIGVFYKAEELSRLAERGNKNLFRIKRIFVPLDELGEVSEGARGELMEKGVELGVMLPAIVSESELDAVKNMLHNAKKQGIMTTLVCNIGHITLCRELGFKLLGDIRLNIYNSFSRELYAEAGITSASLSPELTLPQARDVGGYAVTLGRLPLMITERCFIKENFGCDNCGKAALSDRRGVRFPMMRCFDHRNIILNSSVTYMGDKREELRRAGSVGEYILFTCESAGEIADLLESYFKGKPLNSEMRRMGKREAN